MTKTNAPLLLQAAAAAAGHQHFPAAALYLVATPIGNLADLTLRAIHVLSLVDAVACEDTRHSAVLLQQLGIDKPLLALHQHNEAGAAQGVLQRLAQGQRIAYVSDAGTPAVSDPGALLVAAVQAAGYQTLPIPGASSVLAAVSVAGDAAGSGFRFVGFLPTRAGERQSVLQAALDATATQVLFEAPHRIVALADALAALAPQRRVTLCRELTKQFETIATMAAAELPGWLSADANRQRGEFVVVVHGAPQAVAADAAANERLLRVLMRELPLKQAVALGAELSGAPRNALYEQALALKKAAG
ncbi:16S rRNA (cytidine(1402)-2'-O)-methyltransferase [Piscinibacter sakaiensis]|uniref:16S rRNA (cytidine(1402)-2'-O)-methyltransferase n=1 Tax=Piscinibacter sakaiensis TaxID=1547922 RepID=UPI003AAC80B6